MFPFHHDDVIKWKHFPHYWPFVQGIHRSPVNSPAQRPVMRSFDVFFDLHLNKGLSKQWWGWWFETPSCPLWRHCNDTERLVHCICVTSFICLLIAAISQGCYWCINKGHFTEDVWLVVYKWLKNRCLKFKSTSSLQATRNVTKYYMYSIK